MYIGSRGWDFATVMLASVGAAAVMTLVTLIGLMAVTSRGGRTSAT